ncbi:FxLYD domain-containing protein [Natronococcus sp. A-GB1]|uniref:FxLYD domain-containing protein n=1 Tax=Natronococcus sp. A-GB1 TaxID=3037648 RepID=UPI00241C4BBC|nr:FxLYD domain-containing protein [Natronococcus sp. A-GB1]MDG5759983.1 FxLYD domain-containing protein [Natronococcus sp. A-GB1]
MHRRTVLLGTGVTVSALLAGCASEDGDGADDIEDETDDTEVGSDDETDDENGDDEDEDTDDEDEDETEESDGEDGLEERIEEGPPIEGLVIEEHELVEDDLSGSVEGLIVNESGEDVRSVRVGIVFHDADGERIDEATTSTSELADEEEWSFSVMTLEEGIASYAIGVIEAEPVERSPL